MQPKYLNTPRMAAHIGRHADWLKKRMDGVFVEGVHYFKKTGERDPFWKVEAVERWVESGDDDDIVNGILEKVS